MCAHTHTEKEKNMVSGEQRDYSNLHPKALWILLGVGFLLQEGWSVDVERTSGSCSSRNTFQT